MIEVMRFKVISSFLSLSVLCGGSSWQQKWVKLHEGVIIITNSEKPNHPAKRAKVDTTEREVIDLMKQQGYVHTMVSKSELDSTAGTGKLQYW